MCKYPGWVFKDWKLYQIISDTCFPRAPCFGSTAVNECWHSLLYTTGLLNKAVTFSPIQTDIAIALSVLWNNESEEHVLREIARISNVDLAIMVSSQISAVQMRKNSKKKSISGGKRRLIKMKLKEKNKSSVYEDPELVHTPTRSPNRKKRIFTTNNE